MSPTNGVLESNKIVLVDYSKLDPFKKKCQERAAKTAKNISRLGARFIEPSRGESVAVVDICGERFGFAEEGLGTKCLVADAMQHITGRSYYFNIGIDLVSSVVNDMITLGMLPMVLGMHSAVGDERWFNDATRAEDLINGFGHGCDLARCAWGCGETPVLKGIVVPGTIALATSGVGRWKYNHGVRQYVDPSRIHDGDLVILLESSGIHINGLTTCRAIADSLPQGYETRISDGRTYGEALLDPTHIYVDIIEMCLDEEIDVHYAGNVSGHGWPKIMRAPQPWAYILDEAMPWEPPIFSFIKDEGHMDDATLYSTFNMGAGFFLIIDRGSLARFMRAFKKLRAGWTSHRYSPVVAGHVEKSPVRKLIIKSKGLEYTAESVDIRS